MTTCYSNLPQKSDLQIKSASREPGAEGWFSAGFNCLPVTDDTLSHRYHTIVAFSVFLSWWNKSSWPSFRKRIRTTCCKIPLVPKASRVLVFPTNISAESHSFPRVVRFRLRGLLVASTDRNKSLQSHSDRESAVLQHISLVPLELIISNYVLYLAGYFCAVVYNICRGFVFS